MGEAAKLSATTAPPASVLRIEFELIAVSIDGAGGAAPARRAVSLAGDRFGAALLLWYG
jgi:hypothetical protein